MQNRIFPIFINISATANHHTGDATPIIMKEYMANMIVNSANTIFAVIATGLNLESLRIPHIMMIPTRLIATMDDISIYRIPDKNNSIPITIHHIGDNNLLICFIILLFYVCFKDV